MNRNNKDKKFGKQSRKQRGGLMSGGKQAVASLSRVTEASMPLFPARSRKMLRYHENVTITVTTGALGTYVFRANDLFDPNFTGTGHQPMGFDQMMLYYNHFAVERCRATVVFNNGASATLHAGIRVDGASTALTDPDRLVEDGAIEWDVFEGKSTYGCTKTMTMEVDIAKLQGIPRKNITTDPNLRGDSLTSPLEITYFHVFAWDPSTSLSGAMNFDIVLEFDAYFMEPRDVITSLKQLSHSPPRMEECKTHGGSSCACGLFQPVPIVTEPPNSRLASLFLGKR